MDNLSKKETEVASSVLKGLTNSEIAAQLGIKEVTVKFHITQIYRKANVKNRAQYLVKALGATNG
jgi:DNA-binding NarL/FixJ family response regulator